MKKIFSADAFFSEISPFILYEDNHIIVTVKPQNMPTQSDSSGDKDFLTLIKEYVKEKYAKPGNAYIGLIHRLDRPAGGVMVFAKTSKAAARLNKAMKSGGFEKRYLAVVKNCPDLRERAVLKNYLIKDKNKNTSYVAEKEDKGAKYAELSYITVERNDKTALVEVELKTGRAHQIRVQMSNIGAPLAGDYRYGGAKEGNLALWAYMLCFVHPVKKEEMRFVCPPPDSAPWRRFEPVIKRIVEASKG